MEPGPVGATRSTTAPSPSRLCDLTPIEFELRSEQHLDTASSSLPRG